MIIIEVKAVVRMVDAHVVKIDCVGIARQIDGYAVPIRGRIARGSRYDLAKTIIILATKNNWAITTGAAIHRPLNEQSRG